MNWMDFLEWADISLDTVQDLIRANLGVIATMAYMICILLPIIIGFMFKSSMFRLRETIGAEFVLDLKSSTGSVIIPIILIFFIAKNYNYLPSSDNLLVTLAIFSITTFIFGSYIATVVYYFYRMVTLKSTSLLKDNVKDFHSIKGFLRMVLSIIKSIILDTLRFIINSLQLYWKNPKNFDLYIIYYTYLNKFNDEKLEKIKISKLIPSFIIIWSISYFIIITFTTYSFLKFLLG